MPAGRSDCHRGCKPPEHLRLSQSGTWSCEAKSKISARVSGCKPMRNPASMLEDFPPEMQVRRTLVSGWQGSGIFAISPACRRRRRIADSRRTLPTGLPRDSLQPIEIRGIYVHRCRQAQRDETRSKLSHQHPARRPEGLCRHRRTSEGRDAEALLPRRIAEACQVSAAISKRFCTRTACTTSRNPEPRWALFIAHGVT